MAILAKRVRGAGDYGPRFVSAFDHIAAAEDVGIVDIANALAAFMGTEWQSFDSPYDRALAGDDGALSAGAKAGAAVFYGKGECAACHAGPLFSDQAFHALALPPFGPGRTRRFDPAARDVGRMGETDALEDAYRFRTPMLRNVALTAPYGHNGAYPTLRGIIRHHLSPNRARTEWRREMAALPPVPALGVVDFIIWSDTREMARQEAASDLPTVTLTDAEIDALVAFLESLTGDTARTGRLGIPDAVPSGLPVERGAR